MWILGGYKHSIYSNGILLMMDPKFQRSQWKKLKVVLGVRVWFKLGNVEDSNRVRIPMVRDDLEAKYSVASVVSRDIGHDRISTLRGRCIVSSYDSHLVSGEVRFKGWLGMSRWGVCDRMKVSLEVCCACTSSFSHVVNRVKARGAVFPEVPELQGPLNHAWQ